MLPINFHKTFVPERHLIGALLHYAALGKQGSYQEISAETGIPMGVSTGKVPAILDYARGMGLVDLAGETKSAIKKPVLTPLGRAVYSDDRYLGEELTQWIVHMNLCRAERGASAWRSVFAVGRRVLGSRFTRPQLESYLSGIYGSGNDRTGPLIRAYTDDAALGRARILTTTRDDEIERHKAPILDAYAAAYSAIVLALMEAHFPIQAQVTLSDFERTLWFDICLWNEDDVEQACSLLDRKGFAMIDRQMRPWLLERRATAESVWPHIFDDLA